jgi:streptomycin 6-kinase
MAEPKIDLLDDWRQAILELFPEGGAEWLQGLPGVIEHCLEHWALRLRPSQRDSTASYVIPVQRQDGTHAFLKCGLPDNPEFSSEAWALKCFDGRAAVRLLEVDFERGAMLIERASPGHPLSMFEDDDQATRMAGVLMQRLWRSDPECEALPTLEKWGQGFNRLQGSIGFASTIKAAPVRYRHSWLIVPRSCTLSWLPPPGCLNCCMATCIMTTSSAVSGRPGWRSIPKV